MLSSWQQAGQLRGRSLPQLTHSLQTSGEPTKSHSLRVTNIAGVWICQIVFLPQRVISLSHCTVARPDERFLVE